jgi:tetratricopeptide (TPR) repeat protein
MPRSDTDIPHFAFTHHRIGKHGKSSPVPETAKIADLVLFDENPHMTAIDRERNLGLACIEVSRAPPSAEYARAYRMRGRERLESVYRQGLRDAEVVFALAELSWLDRDVLLARRYLREALEAPGLRPDIRAECLTLLANCELELRDYAGASALLEQSVKLRRSGEDWRILGVSYLHQNLPNKALAAFQNSLAIRPDRPSLHLGLSECFRRMDDTARAKDHLEKAEWIQQHVKE